MLKLDNKIIIDKETIEKANLCDEFSKKDLDSIGSWVFDGWQSDEGSRQSWLKRTDAAMDLALQIQVDKSFPWPNCSNVAFPLVTIAAMQFHARAYPAIILAPNLVNARVIGDDPDGKEKERADRISTHMSWQLLEQDQPWEEQEDRALLHVPIVGCAFKMSYFSNLKGHNVSELVFARDLVMNYWAKSVEDCPRKTRVRRLFRNDVYEKCMRGEFRDVLQESWYLQPAQPSQTTDDIHVNDRTGLQPGKPDETTPFIFFEQHVNFDLDQDGYAEPLIITVEKNSKAVVRICLRFDREADVERTPAGKIICIRAMEYFTKKGFIPSPDGGIYDLGFGVLLGPLNESVNTLVNQMIDSGTMSTTAGGFLGRGAKIRGGVYTFAPFQWNRVDSSGDDLQKSIFPLPVREPSAVLFQLLSLLINYTQRISGSTDMLVGENPGQNTPAQTSQEMVAQGEKIFSAIFKRLWRSSKEEFKKLFVLNAIFLPTKATFGENGAFALREDYLGDPSRVVPVADPNIKSETQVIQAAQFLSQRAQTVPGYDTDAVEMNLLSALKVSAPKTLFKGTDGAPPPTPEKVQIEQMKLQGKEMQHKYEMQQFIIELQSKQELIRAQVAELSAQAELYAAQAEGSKNNQSIAFIDAMLGAAKQQSDHVNSMIGHLLKSMEIEADAKSAAAE